MVASDKDMIYTSIFGRRDNLRLDIPCFTTPLGFAMPSMNAKAYKVLSHLFVPQDSVWVDGNIFTKAKESDILDRLLGEHDLAAFKHPWRDTPAQEAQTVIEMGIANKYNVDLMLQLFPQLEKLPLYECGILLRRNNDLVRQFNEEWWRLINLFSSRDQITFPLAIERTPKLKVRRIEANLREHKFFDFHGHVH